ncbi:flagellar hook-associated protein 2 [Pseudomonas laurentiana]|uniref:Flagellar hook-associated protein 2 n=1 Tax=Pseudomonas laurentiana TaxID=2364649 RepID=A0A6I5RP81_9PSED|nr:flagellar filament capping protein FliD [Pseudomonas laurentiana]NES09396.1 flagellar filament capping protein FliD [Pseudomonas laurentiana]GGU65699.1 flagellar hook-associated protein 2 [Pseudomonas laurentiana]
MASPITSTTGMGSGLNIGSIVEALVNSDTAAKQAQITRQTTNNKAYISGVGALKSALAAYQASMKKLNDSAAPSFNAYAASSANENVLKATASNTAVPGTYEVNVSQLATGSKVASRLFATADGGAATPIPKGDLAIEQNGKTYTVSIGDGATLQSVRDSINDALAVNGISANIINESGGARLVLGSTTTGAGSDIKVIGGATGISIDGTKPMATNGSGYISALAQDAKLTIDGLAVTSKSNTVENAISGITLDLVAVSSGAATTKVTVGANNDGLKASVQQFVDAYNTMVKAVNALTATSTDANGNTVLGSLTGDATTRSLLADIRSELATIGSGDRLTSLSQLGINTQKDGTLEFNGTKFTAAMNDKKLGNEVQELFTGTNGVFERMNKAIEPYIKTDGVLTSRANNLNALQKRLDQQQEDLDRRVELLTASLTKKYIAMDTVVGKLKAQANSITSIFEAITAQQRNS